MWRALRHVLPAKKEQDSIPNELDCNKFNDYFATIGNNLTCNLDTNKPLPSINVPKPTHPFIFTDIDFHYIRSKIIDLPDKAYPDSVGIDNIMLKLAADVIAISLTNILNLSLQTSELPNEWKTARITPIYKKNGSKFECNNYRPISILPTIAKILELAVKEQIVSHFTKHNLFSENQSAYIKGRSTVTALHNITDKWLNNIIYYINYTIMGFRTRHSNGLRVISPIGNKW